MCNTLREGLPSLQIIPSLVTFFVFPSRLEKEVARLASGYIPGYLFKVRIGQLRCVLFVYNICNILSIFAFFLIFFSGLRGSRLIDLTISIRRNFASVWVVHITRRWEVIKRASCVVASTDWLIGSNMVICIHIHYLVSSHGEDDLSTELLSSLVRQQDQFHPQFPSCMRLPAPTSRCCELWSEGALLRTLRFEAMDSSWVA